MLDAIVAVYGDWGIGDHGTQPIVVDADRKRFRDITGHDAVLVGRKTLAEFPGGRPLKGRHNIVLSTRALEIAGAEVVHSVDEALAAAARQTRCLVIGGASVYREFLPHIGRIFVTKLDCVPHCDAFFPDLDADPAWVVTEEGPWETDENGVGYCFLTYERVQEETDAESCASPQGVR